MTGLNVGHVGGFFLLPEARSPCVPGAGKYHFGCPRGDSFPPNKGAQLGVTLEPLNTTVP